MSQPALSIVLFIITTPTSYRLKAVVWSPDAAEQVTRG